MAERDAVLAELEDRAADLRDKLAGRKPFRVPTDDFRRSVLKIGLAACEKAAEKRRKELADDA